MSDSIEHTTPKVVAAPSSRRALLTAGLGAIAASVASAVGRPLPARANGEYIQLGATYTTATTVTQLENSTNAAAVFTAWSHGDGTGVSGLSDSYYGVQAYSNTGVGLYSASGSNIAIYGQSNSSTGILGNSTNGLGVSGTSTNWYGVAGASSTLYGVYGEANGSGAGAIGVHGTSAAGIGMLGKSRAAAQPGTIGWSGGNSTGVQGISNANDANPPTPRAKTGVMGQATQDAASLGVLGISAAGDGVRGEVTSGAAVRGVASGAAGYAFRGSGRLLFEKVSGVATIAAGQTTVVVTPGTGVATSSFVLLTAQTNIGTRTLSVSMDATNDRFTIRMSSSRSSSTKVAWLLLS